MSGNNTPGGGDAGCNEYTLKEDNELRFEVGAADCVLELLSGRAEIFGTEIELHKKYVFPPGSRVAVFTWSSARVEIMGATASAYVAEQTPMVIYLNTHAALEQMRQAAESGEQRKPGPRIMLVGPTDVGKSTVCRILCNYAVRQGRSPIFVDLDVGQGSISVPGTIGALYVNKTADVSEGFDKSRPLVYNFGHASPSANLPLYDMLVKELADTVTSQCLSNEEAYKSGVVINTCGWVNGEGYQCLVNAAEAFEVEVVVVLDHERLFNDLQRDLPPFVKILHQPKSGGVENRSKEVRVSSRSLAIHRYFYGTRSISMNPYAVEMPFDTLKLAQIGTEKLPDSCLPFGTVQEDHNTKVVKVQPSPSLINRLLAVTSSPVIDKNIAKENVVGFVSVTEVNMEQRYIMVLSPQNPLPDTVLIQTDIQFSDDNQRRQ